jgi:transketolase
MAGFNTDSLLKGNSRDLTPKKILEFAREDEDIVFIVSDWSTDLGAYAQFRAEFPKRFIDVGIAEMNGVGAATGLALAGKKPYFMGFGPFISLRATDQIHTDVAYNDLPVRLIGTHGGMTSGGGPTHYAIADFGIIRCIPNMTMIAPSDANQCLKVLEASRQYQGPIYIRISRGEEPLIYPEDSDYEYVIGKAITVREGVDATLIGTGIGVFNSIKAAELLEKKGMSIRVLDMHTIKPLDSDAVIAAAKETGCVVTVEDHNTTTGLGSAVAGVLAEVNLDCRFKSLGIPDEFPPFGYADDLYAHYKMDGSGVAAALSKLIA